MNKKTDLTDIPYELQERILDKLDQEDHISMHQVSKSWQFMIAQYLRNFFII